MSEHMSMYLCVCVGGWPVVGWVCLIVCMYVYTMYMYVCVCCIGAVLGQFDATEARCVSMEGRYIHVYTYMYTVYSVYNSVLDLK